MPPFPSTRRCIGALIIAVVMGCGFLSPLRADTPSVAFPGSIRPVPTTSAAATHEPRHARVSRLTLRSDENAALVTFEVALRMRNFGELQQRVARGETVSPAEKEARYFPAKADHDAVVAWLKSQGLEVTRTDHNRLAVFGRGTVAAVARAFHTSFARVATDDGEFTSAVTAPSLPADIASAVAGVHGLQPHLRRRVLSFPRSQTLSPDASSGYLPSQIAQAYNANSLSATGAGQTIAIYAFAFPLSSDLSQFWSITGVSQSLSNIQTVNVAGGPASSPSNGYSEEVTLDVEWASSLAPGAVIRVYGANENDPADNDEILQQVYEDATTIPSLHTLSICIGGNELDVEHDYLTIEAQYMANLASAGITVLSASGDSGAYAAGQSAGLEVTYPTSDPDVTGVGGTSLILNGSGGVMSETAWSDSGGGVSAVFSRPSWQTGAGVPGGTMRLVPDVAGPANPNEGAYYIFDGQASEIGGTSWATPVWAGFCACIDQARAASSLPPLGLLNTTIYPLIGTAALRDIVSGSNGYYSASTGYDLCTGVGVPVVSVLAQAALTPSSAPIVASQLGSRITVSGQPATFSIAAYGAAVAYHWQRLPAGQSSWVSLSDNGTYSGSATNTLVVSGTTLAMSRDEFQCIVTNGSGTAISPAAILTVDTTGVTTFAGWPGAAGSVDGTGWQARFSYPGGVRLNAAGNMFVADSSNYTVRQITPAGAVTTLAGKPGVSGSTDGPVGSALFSGIGGVAPDAQGNIYVADSGNYTIREITSGGSVTTIAGTAGTSAHLDGTGSAARFSDPQNLAFDPTSGNLYVADGAGNTIRRVTPAGVVTTLAGSASGAAGSANGTGTAASFRDPAGIAVDSAGNVYVADTGNDTIRKITPAGVVTTLAGVAGRSGNSDGTSGRFDEPAGVAVDSVGNVYVADSGNDTIREVSSSGSITTLAGVAGDTEDIDGLAPDARFWTPGDLSLDSSGNIYVADTYNMTIRRLVVELPVEPALTTSPQSQTIAAGSGATLSVTATGTAPLSYQWYLNGAAIAGATSSTLAFSEVGTEQAGSYTVVVTNSAGSATSQAAQLTVTYAAQLINLSARADVGTGASILIGGLTIGGSGAKNLLLRGDGPALASAQPSLEGQVVTAPQLTLFDGSSVEIVSDAGWENAFTTGSSSVSVSPQAATTSFMNSVGAYPPFASGSADSAMEVTPQAGSCTFEIAGVGGATGIGQAEIYDADPSSGARLTNISARAGVGTGADILIGGFVITGSTSETILIRGDGPALQNELSGILTAPEITLIDSTGKTIAYDIGWSTPPTLGNSTVQAGIQAATAALMNSVGASPTFTAGSADCAMVATLPPGAYTVELSGVGGATGIALMEIYEVP